MLGIGPGVGDESKYRALFIVYCLLRKKGGDVCVCARAHILMSVHSRMCVCMHRLSKRNPGCIKQNLRDIAAQRRGSPQGEGHRCRRKASVSAHGGRTLSFETCQYFTY